MFVSCPEGSQNDGQPGIQENKIIIVFSFRNDVEKYWGRKVLNIYQYIKGKKTGGTCKLAQVADRKTHYF